MFLLSSVIRAQVHYVLKSVSGEESVVGLGAACAICDDLYRLPAMFEQEAHGHAYGRDFLIEIRISPIQCCGYRSDSP